MTEEEATQLVATIASSQAHNVFAVVHRLGGEWQIQLSRVIVDPRYPWTWTVKSPSDWARIALSEDFKKGS